jgi:hypothetical protein
MLNQLLLTIQCWMGQAPSIVIVGGWGRLRDCLRPLQPLCCAVEPDASREQS